MMPGLGSLVISTRGVVPFAAIASTTFRYSSTPFRSFWSASMRHSAKRFAQAFGEFIARFRVVQLSRGIAWRAAMMQGSISRRLGENDAWIAATAVAYGATLVGRDAAFKRVPKLDYLRF